MSGKYLPRLVARLLTLPFVNYIFYLEARVDSPRVVKNSTELSCVQFPLLLLVVNKPAKLRCDIALIFFVVAVT